MDLHGIASGLIGRVNPFVTIQFRASAGYTTSASGRRTPTYAAAVSVQAQVQALTTQDLRQLDGLNIQGSERTIYMHGIARAAVRPAQKGGDMITLPDGTIWLTTAVLEQWPDWVKVAVTLQNGQ